MEKRGGLTATMMRDRAVRVNYRTPPFVGNSVEPPVSGNGHKTYPGVTTRPTHSGTAGLGGVWARRDQRDWRDFPIAPQGY
jgi:hypothetical protein